MVSRRCGSSNQGLSPRRRGNRIHGLRHPRGLGPIPAQAGEPVCCNSSRASIRAYPRAGGGTRNFFLSPLRRRGLSPRRRGNPSVKPRGDVVPGPIPAQAGEPICESPVLSATRAYPRAGGGTTVVNWNSRTVSGLSPRRRGNLFEIRIGLEREGPIPAQAGEPAPPRAAGRRVGAYPRAGGGTLKFLSLEVRVQGLSPRRRGNLHDAGAEPIITGPIPAQAGEPRSATRARY